MIAASKETGMEILKKWVKGVKNHLYWSVTSTKPGFTEMISAKWQSLMYHICDKHKEFPGSLFTECTHGELEKRDWIEIGEEYNKQVS